VEGVDFVRFPPNFWQQLNFTSRKSVGTCLSPSSTFDKEDDNSDSLRLQVKQLPLADGGGMGESMGGK
jgi:hypothetical protein